MDDRTRHRWFHPGQPVPIALLTFALIVDLAHGLIYWSAIVAFTLGLDLGPLLWDRKKVG